MYNMPKLYVHHSCCVLRTYSISSYNAMEHNLEYCIVFVKLSNGGCGNDII